MKISIIAVLTSIFLQACFSVTDDAAYPHDWSSQLPEPSANECLSIKGTYMNTGQSSDKSARAKSLATLLLGPHDDLREASKIIINQPNDGIIQVAIWGNDRLIQEKFFLASKEMIQDTFKCGIYDGIAIYRGPTFEVLRNGWSSGTVQLHLNKSEDGSLVVREIKTGLASLLYVIPVVGHSSTYYLFKPTFESLP